MGHSTTVLILNMGLLGMPLLAQTSLSLPSASANPGAVVSLGLTLTTAGTAPAGLQWTLSYPATQISSVSVTSGPTATAAGKTVTCASSPGSTTCILIGMNATTMSTGVAAFVNLTMAPTATTTSVAIANPLAVDPSGTAISVPIPTASVITVSSTSSSPNITSLSCAPALLGPSGSSTCSVGLSIAAPAGGSAVTLSSSSTLLTAPASVTVAAGVTAATFSATAATTIPSNQSATVTAKLGSSSQTATINLMAPVLVSTLGCTPSSLAPSAVSTCTVTLTQAAPAGGSAVTLSSSSTLLTAPASVTVAAGATTATFSATAATTILSNQSATVTAKLGTSSQTATIKLISQVLVSPLFIQEHAVANGTANPSIISLSTASTSGNLLIVAVTYDNENANVLSITDNKRNYYKRALSGMNWGPFGGQARSELWYAANITGGGTPIAATVKLSASSTSFVQLHISEYSGLAAVDPLDQVANKSGLGNFSGIFSSPSMRISSNELMFGHCEMWSGTVGAGPEFTAHIAAGGNIDESRDVSSSGSYVASCAESGSGPMIMTATFKARATASNVHSISTLAAPTEVDTLRSLSCAPGNVSAGSVVSCELRVAPTASPVEAKLESNSDEIRIPAAVTTRPNQSSVTFQARVDAMARTHSPVISANLGGIEVHDSIHVTSASGPIIAAPESLKARIGAPVSFAIRASDPSDLPLAITADGVPAGAVFDPVRGRLEWIPGASQAGSYKVTFTATNPVGLSSTARVSLDVGPGGPVLNQTQQASCSPGSIASLKGNWLSTADFELSDPTGSSFDLGGTRIIANGQEAPVLYSSNDRVDFLCPALEPGTQLAVTVETGSGTSSPWTSIMRGIAPRILAVSHAVSDDTVTDRDFTESGHPAQPGDEVVLWVTGLDRASATSARLGVYADEMNAQIESVDAVPERSGVYAIHYQVPAGTSFGAVPVELRVITPGGREVRSNAVVERIEPTVE